VKITVIATGFGAPRAARPADTLAQTPVDLTPYAEHARQRVEASTAAVAMDRLSGSRLSIARRPALDLPAATASVAAGMVAAAAGGGGAQGEPAGGGDGHADFDLSSTFDVPAFLRRQEG